MGVCTNDGQCTQERLAITLRDEDSNVVEFKIRKLLYKDTQAVDKFEEAERVAFIRSIILLMGDEGCLTEPIAA